MNVIWIKNEFKIKNMIRLIGLIGLMKFLQGCKNFFYNYILKKLGWKNTKQLKEIKWVLVTGTTSGLGWKLMELFIKQNIGVICVGRNQSKLNNIVEFMKKKNFKKFHIIHKDLGKMEDIIEYEVEWENILKKYPQVDLFINNAGISFKGNIKSISYSKFIMFFNVNIISPLILNNAYIKSQLKKQDSNINIILSSSGLSKIPIGYSAFYPYTKHLANNNMKYLNRSLKTKEIKFHLNSVLLGQIYSNISNMTGVDWDHENDENNSHNLYFGYISSTRCAESMIFQGFGEKEIEILANPDHFLKFFFVRWWNLNLAIYLLTKKRHWMIENNINTD